MIELYGFGGLLAKGTLITIKLGIVSWLFGMLFGVMGVVMKISPFWILQKLADIYTTVVRGIPELLFVLFIGLGGDWLARTILKGLNYSADLQAVSFWLGVLALSVMFGAYATEVFRMAFNAIPKGQWEASDSLGFSRFKTFFRIILPQMWAVALAGISNLTLVLLKDTALISLLGLQDLMFFGQRASQVTQKPFLFFMAIALIYLVLTSIVMVLMGVAKWRANPAKRYARKLAKHKATPTGGI